MEKSTATRPVLIPLPSARTLELRNGRTVRAGYFLSELAGMVTRLIKKGYDPVFATPDGREPQVDPLSDSPLWFSGRIRAYLNAKRLVDQLEILSSPLTFAQVVENGLDRYAGIFVPGGYGVLSDLPSDAVLGRIFRAFHGTARPIGLIGHGPVALLSALDDPEGFLRFFRRGDLERARQWAKGWPFHGYRISLASPIEEQVARIMRIAKWRTRGLPYSAAKALRLCGAETNTSLRERIIADRELLTAQSPLELSRFADAFLSLLEESSSAPGIAA